MAHKLGEHLDDSTVHAWLDGALPAAEAAQVEAHVQQCDACAERVARARGLIAAASRILSALDDVPVHVMPAGRRRQPVVWWGWPLRVAASLLVVAGGSVIVARQLREPVPASVEVSPTTVTPPPPAAAAPVQPQASPPPPRPKQRAGVAANAAPRVAPPPDAASALADSAPGMVAREAHAPTAARAASVPVCYDVVQPAAASVPKRIVLDTGHAALLNAKVAHWTAPAPDSVEVVTGDQATVAGRVTPSGLTGAASAAPNAPPQPFTAKRCPPR
jgi:anti-sigma factor RsiW